VSAAGLAVYLGAVAGVAAAGTGDYGLRVGFALSAAALLGTSVALLTGFEARLALRSVTVLAGAAFGLVLTDLADQSLLAADRYHAIWVPSVLGLLAVLGQLGSGPRVVSRSGLGRSRL
jgi:hypothetical protein